MFNWLTRPRKPRLTAKAAESLVVNAGGTMTWADIFGTITHEQTYASNLSSSLRLSAVKCALDIYTGMVVDVPRRMYAIESGSQQKTDVVSTTSHPASRMFSHYFNPELSADDAILSIVYDVLMDGNCYFLRELDNQGRTARGYYIHPSRIPRGNIYRSKGGEKIAANRLSVAGELLYKVETGLSTADKYSEPILIPRSDIIHFKNKILDNEYNRGQGFVLNAAKNLELYKAAEEFGWKFYTKGVNTQTFLTTEQRLAPEVLKRIEANFEVDPDAPLDQIFRTRVLEQGVKPLNIGIPFQQLQFIETRAFSVEDVARGLNIPPVLLHSHMGTDGGSVDIAAAINQFIQTGIGPLLSRIAAQFRSECLPLSSQMLYVFVFERLFLYRSVIDKFTASLRNLFEIGVVRRRDAAELLGMHIDPADEAADPRYVPVNLMTVEHSLYLEDGAELNNEMLTKQIEQQQKTNEGLVDPATIKPSTQPNAKGEPPSGKMNKSPDGDNLDKRIRNIGETAFRNVITGLKQYEARVLDQKKTSRPDDYETARTEFYAINGKFETLLGEQLFAWKDIITANKMSMDELKNNWIVNKSCPEGIEDEITCA